MASPIKTRSQGPAEDLDLDHPAGGAEADALLIGVHPPTRLEKELAFYSAYHRNETNKAIHFVFVPALCISGLILLDHLRLPDASSQILAPGLATQWSAGLITILGYCAYYIYLDPIGGTLFLPIGAAFYLTTTYLTLVVPDWLPFRNAWSWHASALPFGTYLFFGSWVVQFIGHGVFERRAPALLDNLGQALVLAPFFVFLEALFGFFNYKPALAKRVNNLAVQKLMQMNRAAKAKSL